MESLDKFLPTFKDPQSRACKALGWSLLLAAVTSYLMLNLAVFDIPVDIPRVLWQAAILLTAICGAAGFLMVKEPGRAKAGK